MGTDEAKGNAAEAGGETERKELGHRARMLAVLPQRGPEQQARCAGGHLNEYAAKNPHTPGRADENGNRKVTAGGRNPKGILRWGVHGGCPEGISGSGENNERYKVMPIGPWTAKMIAVAVVGGKLRVA